MSDADNLISTNKKHNVRYWDGLDNLTEDYVRELARNSIPEKQFSDDDYMFFAKALLDSAVKLLEGAGCKFPYVDENY